MNTTFEVLRAPFKQGRTHNTLKGLAIGLLTAVIVGCGGGHVSNAGQLDATFGTANDGTPNGIVNLSLGDGNDYGRAVAVQADGKIVVAGTSTSTGGDTHNIIVERFNTDGTLDTSFGAGNSDGSPDGVVSLDLGVSDDVANAVKIQTDGKIVVAGTSTPTGGTSNIILVRLNSNGALDDSFGADSADGTPAGVVSVNLSDVSNDVANALAIQSDGKILVAGTTSDGSTKNAMVARVKVDGTLDATFGAGNADGTPDGVVSASFSNGDDEAKAMALQSDGKILVAGTTFAGDGSTNAVVARFLTDGALDSSFGAGTTDGTPDGVASASFSDGNDVANAIAVQANGMILLAGTTTAADSSTNVVVARLNTDGTLDASFGADSSDGTPDGVVGISLGQGNDAAAALVVQTDGRIVVAGTTIASDSSSNAVVVRLNADGTLDAKFGAGTTDGTPDGVVGISLGAGDDIARALVLQADGRILVAGDHINAGSSDIWVARVLVN